MRGGRKLAGTVVVGVLCVGMFGAAAVAARAGTTIGSDLTGTTAGTWASHSTIVNTTQRTADLTPLTAPASGVLVRLRIRHGATGTDPGTYAYRIMSGSAPDFTARPATPCGTDQAIGFLANAPGGIDTYIPTDFEGRPRGIPITAGEQLGITITPPAPETYDAGAGSGAVMHIVDGNHSSGTQTYPTAFGFHMFVQGVIEPDADGDGFGDESQDDNPAVASEASCTAPVQPVVVPQPSPPADAGDFSAPNAAITGGPKDKTGKKEATFVFTGTDTRAVASFQCSLDGATFSTCTSPFTVKVKKGKHTFQVRAIDEAGNVGIPASDSWKRKKKRKTKT